MKKVSESIQNYLNSIQIKGLVYYNKNVTLHKEKINQEKKLNKEIKKKLNQEKDLNQEKEIQIPTIQTLFDRSYTIHELKEISRYYNLKISGTKKQLSDQLFYFLYFSHYVIKIQHMWKNKILRKYNKLHGPAYLKRRICTNEYDFISMEPLHEIECHQFISYKDNDGFIYGFDICSLYNLVKTSIVNPYNRSVIPTKVIANMKRILRMGPLLNHFINLKYDDDSSKVSEEKEVELRCLKLFQFIDSLGNYSDMKWFFSLNRAQLIVFVRELMDIWNYRAQLSNQIKRNISPNSRGPFRNMSIQYIMTEEHIWNVKKVIIEVMEQFVYYGIDKDSQIMGAYYILGSLTLVSINAAVANPWLYQSFVM